MSREWDRSEVMSEFLKIAADSGLINPDLKQEEGLGNPTKDTPVKGCTRNEPTEDYGVKTEPKDIIDKAHPEQAWMAKNSTPVQSMGEGSLVENIKEQQEKNIEIATKMPHGTLLGVHANLIQDLVKLANTLEDQGKVKEAARVDEAIKKISIYPFDDGHLHKTAAVWFLIPLLLAGGYGGAKMFGHTLTSKQENLRIDLKDLHDKLEDKGNRSKSALSAAKLLAPFIPRFEKMDLSTKSGFDQYAKLIRDLAPIMKRVGVLVMAARQDIGERSGFFSKLWGGIKDLFGFEDYKLIAEKYGDCLQSYKAARKYVNEAQRVEKEVASKVEEDVPRLTKTDSFDSILASGFMGKKYKNLEDLETDLNAALQKLYEAGKLKKSLKADIVRDGKPTSTPAQLREVLEIVEKKLAS